MKKVLKGIKDNWKTSVAGFLLFVFTVAWLTGKMESEYYFGSSTFVMGWIALLAKDYDKEDSK